jgi:hypothetical protein
MILELPIANQLLVNMASASKHLSNVNSKDILNESFLILKQVILILMMKKQQNYY